MNKFHIRFLSVCLFVPLCLTAQERTLDTTVEAGFHIDAFESVIETTDEWKTAEQAELSVTARKSGAFALTVRVESNFNSEPMKADDVLKELALSFTPLNIAAVTVGKQNLKWGTARVFSSIDSLASPINPLDPSSSDRGVTGIKIEVIPTWWMSVSLLALPAPILDETRLASRAEFLAGETDISIGAVRKKNLEGNEEPSFIADFARFFDRFGIYGEAQVTKKTEWEQAATGGLQVDIPAWLSGTITLLGEYRYQSDVEAGTHMVYAGISSIPVTRKIRSGISCLFAPEERQAVEKVTLDWDIDQSMSAHISYEYLADWEKENNMLIPLFTTNRHTVSVGVTAFY